MVLTWVLVVLLDSRPATFASINLCQPVLANILMFVMSTCGRGRLLLYLCDAAADLFVYLDNALLHIQSHLHCVLTWSNKEAGLVAKTLG